MNEILVRGTKKLECAKTHSRQETTSYKMDYCVLQHSFPCSIHLFVMIRLYPYYKTCAQFFQTGLAKKNR